MSNAFRQIAEGLINQNRRRSDDDAFQALSELAISNTELSVISGTIPRPGLMLKWFSDEAFARLLHQLEMHVNQYGEK